MTEASCAMSQVPYLKLLPNRQSGFAGVNGPQERVNAVLLKENIGHGRRTRRNTPLAGTTNTAYNRYDR